MFLQAWGNAMFASSDRDGSGVGIHAHPVTRLNEI